MKKYLPFFFFLFFFPFQTHAAISTNLVSYWNLNGNSTDSVGSNNGTDTSVSYNTSYGKISSGASFNGTYSRINVGNNSSLTGITSTVTVAGWVYVPSLYTNVSAPEYVLRQGTESSSNWGISIVYFSSHDYLEFRIAPPTGGGRSQYGNTTALTTGWHYLVAETVTGAANTSLWVDGVSQNIINDDTSASAYNFQTVTASTYIGSDSAGYYFTGYIDEIGIWSRALSTTEISQLYNAGSGLPYPFVLPSLNDTCLFFSDSAGNTCVYYVASTSALLATTTNSYINDNISFGLAIIITLLVITLTAFIFNSFDMAKRKH